MKSYQRPPLFNAVWYGEAETVVDLIKNGAPINQVYDGATALVWAIKHYWSRIAGILIKHGADHTIVDRTGSTAMMIAIRVRDIDTVDVLLEHGAKLTTDTTDTLPILNEIVFGQHCYLWDDPEVFMDDGDFNTAKDKYGNTALMLAARGGYTNIVDMLLKHGADPKAVNALNCTALMVAKNVECRVNIVQQIINITKKRIVEVYMAMLPLEQPVYQVWWIMEFELGNDILLLNEKWMIELLQGMRNRYNAMKLRRLKPGTDDG